MTRPASSCVSLAAHGGYPVIVCGYAGPARPVKAQTLDSPIKKLTIK